MGEGLRLLPLLIMKTSAEILDEVIDQDDIPLKDRTDIPKGFMNEHLAAIVKKFYEKQIDNFPALCEEAKVTNITHIKQLAEVGYKTSTKMIGGKVYEGTTGWSKDLNFKHRWIISLQLSNFMRNLIYRDFWTDDNAKVRDKFMKDVIKGVDSYDLLRTLRSYYGTNPNPVVKETING